jgi:hypothetical protein
MSTELADEIFAIAEGEVPMPEPNVPLDPLSIAELHKLAVKSHWDNSFWAIFAVGVLARLEPIAAAFARRMI